MMRRRLPIMLMQPILVLENPIAGVTIVVGLVIMVEKLILVGKVLVAVLAVVVSPTLHPMLFEPEISGKIDITIITDIMIGGVAEVLHESVVTKVAVAAVTVGHGGGLW